MSPDKLDPDPQQAKESSCELDESRQARPRPTESLFKLDESDELDPDPQRVHSNLTSPDELDPDPQRVHSNLTSPTSSTQTHREFIRACRVPKSSTQTHRQKSSSSFELDESRQLEPLPQLGKSVLLQHHVGLLPDLLRKGAAAVGVREGRGAVEVLAEHLQGLRDVLGAQLQQLEELLAGGLRVAHEVLVENRPHGQAPVPELGTASHPGGPGGREDPRGRQVRRPERGGRLLVDSGQGGVQPLAGAGEERGQDAAVQEDPQGAGGRVGPGHGQAGVEGLEAVAVQVEVADAREGRVHVLHHAGDAGPGLEQHGPATVVRLAQQPHGAGQEL